MQSALESEPELVLAAVSVPAFLEVGDHCPEAQRAPCTLREPGVGAGGSQGAVLKPGAALGEILTSLYNF